MSYLLPLARIYQQLEDVSPTLTDPDLPACVIGRCYQILTYAEDKSTIFAGAYDNSISNVFTPPSLTAGAILDEDSVALYFDDMYIETASGTFASVVDTAYVEDVGASFDTDDIDVGDIVVIDHASLGAPLERTILEIEATKLHINKNFTAVLSGATYSVRKKLDDKLMVSSDYTIDDGEISVLPSRTYTYNLTAYSVATANMYLEYKALRTDLSSSVGDISTTAEILANLGKIVPENPLAFGVSLCKDNTVTSVKYIAVGTESDLGWSSVKDILENDTSVYFLALLTDDSSIIGTFKTHCEQMSTADEHGWRVCSGGTPLVTTKTISTDTDGEIFDNAGTLTFRDNDATFLTDGVAAADVMTITAPVAVTGSYTINKAVNDNVIEVVTGTPFPQVDTAITYTITRTLSKTQQAAEVAGAIDSYDSKRTIIVWPDLIEVSDEEVDGFFLGCVIAGMVAGLPPHQGFTNLGVAGVDRLFNSNTYFNKDQLNTIAEAGGYIFAQETPNSLPYSRHQLTTDTQFVETKELNVVKNFDHLSYYFFDVLKTFIGTYNITDQTVGLVLDSISLAADAKMAATLPKIGAPLKSYTLEGEASEISSDTLDARARLDLPKPLNNINFYLAI